MSKVYEIDGRRWIKISEAARLLKTNAVGIRSMMGDGRLDWRQSRANSRMLVVDEIAVMTTLKAKPLTPPTQRKIKDDRIKLIDGERRERGGLWTDHHLRLTLPTTESLEANKACEPDRS